MTEQCVPLSPDGTIEGLEWSMSAHLRDVADECRRSPWPDLIARHGSFEGWLEHCRVLRQADDDDRLLARVILQLMQDAPGRPRGTLRPAERKRLLADPEVAAYFASIAASGDVAWEETRRSAPTGFAVRLQLPIWRRWGAILLEADAFADLESMFAPP